MSEEEIDKQFREIADAFIDLANTRAEGIPAETVGMAMLYAVSRFNAYVVAAHAGSAQKYAEDQQPAKKYFLETYQKMLEENLEDYKKIFDTDLKYAHLMSKNKT